MTRLAATFILVLALGAATVRAESTEGPPAPRSLLERLGTPARATVVDEMLAKAGTVDPNLAVRLAHALGFAGGPAAVRGVSALLEHPSEEVRLAALSAAARLELRFEVLRGRILKRIEEGERRERIVALEALGHVGDGRDLPGLLDLAAHKEPRIAAASFVAMERLTAAQIPYVHARWAWLWKSFHKRAAILLPQAREGMAEAEAAPDLRSLAALVKLYGWTDLPATREAIGQWLVHPGYELRTVACTLAADLRLADLVPALEQALHFAPNEEVAAAARNALVRLEALAPPAEPEGADDDA